MKNKDRGRKIPSVKELKKLCQKPEPPKYWRDRFLRKISIRFTKLFLMLGMTPNQVSFLVLIFGIISALFYMTGQYFYLLIGLLFHHLHFIFDGCDGEVARFRKTNELEDTRGVYLDGMTHAIVIPLLIMGVAIGSYFNNFTPFPDATFLIAGFFGGYSLLLLNFSRVKKYEVFTKKGRYDILKKINRILSGKEGKSNWLRTEIEFLLGFELFNLMFVFTILNLVPYLVLFYAIFFTLFAIRRFYLGYKNIERI